MNTELDIWKRDVLKQASKKYLFICILIIIVTCTFLILMSQILSIKNIEIEGSTGIRGIENYFGRNMLLLSNSDMAVVLKKSNPKLSEVTITKIYPDSLKLITTLKHPSVIVKLADGYMTLAADGYIIQKSKEISESHVPLIRYYQPLFYNQFSIGEPFDNQDIQTATRMNRNMQDGGVRVSSIDIASENMLVLHTEQFDVFMTSEKDADTQFAEFEYTYKKLKIDGMKFSSIDVRFEKPIIKIL